MNNSIVSLKTCALCREIPDLLPKKGRIITIIDAAIVQNYGTYFPMPQISINTSEKSKSLKMVERITTMLLALEADRETTIVAAGGGVVTDLCGFVASTYMRGVPFVFVPTTLLAMVDAAIGGKNGVNLSVYKNIIGLFRMPEHTIVCPHFLHTLPPKEYKEGLAEMVKSFILADREAFFTFISLSKETQSDYKSISPYIFKAAAIKRAIVERDPFEKGERKLLNLGHTFAHAIELTKNISHGKAVGIGIALAAKLSVKRSLLKQEECDTIIAGLNKIGLKTSSPVPMSKVVDVIKKDKKRSGDVIHFVLIRKIGEAVIHPLPINELNDILYDLS